MNKDLMTKLCIPCPDPALILPKCNVQHPVQAVFNPQCAEMPAVIRNTLENQLDEEIAPVSL